MKPLDYQSVVVFVNLVDANQIHRSGAVAYDMRHVQRFYRGTMDPCEVFFENVRYIFRRGKRVIAIFLSDEFKIIVDNSSFH